MMVLAIWAGVGLACLGEMLNIIKQEVNMTRIQRLKVVEKDT